MSLHPSPLTLCGDQVRPTSDRNVFEVKSRSRGRWHRVDGEARSGQMSCSCESYNIHKNRECWHIVQARKFVSIIAMQGSLLAHEQ